jgi:hypothetical protein
MSPSPRSCKKIFLTGLTEFTRKGSALPHGPLPLTGPVTVQLVDSDTGVCFEATYSASQIEDNDAERFSANAP